MKLNWPFIKRNREKQRLDKYFIKFTYDGVIENVVKTKSRKQFDYVVDYWSFIDVAIIGTVIDGETVIGTDGDVDKGELTISTSILFTEFREVEVSQLMGYDLHRAYLFTPIEIAQWRMADAKEKV